MKILVTGGARFVGSHVSEYYAKKGDEVTVFDNLSRGETLKTASKSESSYNWNYLKKFENIELVGRDILYVSDLVRAYDSFLESNERGTVCNIGGGPNNTISFLELLNLLEEKTGKRPEVSFSDCRPSDQKVYTTDITKAEKELNWRPQVSVKEGVEGLVEWAQEHKFPLLINN